LFSLKISVRKGKKIVTSEGDFIFKSETRISCQGLIAIRISPRSKHDLTQPFSIGRGDEMIPKKVADLRGQVRLPNAPEDEEQNTVSYKQVSFANSRKLGDFTVLISKWMTRLLGSLTNFGETLPLLPLYVCMILDACFPYNDL
jgi:hypothetical protein